MTKVHSNASQKAYNSSSPSSHCNFERPISSSLRLEHPNREVYFTVISTIVYMKTPLTTPTIVSITTA